MVKVIYPKSEKELTPLVAMIMTDGGISKSGKEYEIYFIQKYIEPCLYFKELIEKPFGISVKVDQRKDGRFRARIRSKELFQYLSTLVKGVRKEDRIIPDFIMEDPELGKEFLKIAFGSEGSACYDKKRYSVKIEIACKPQKFKEQLQELLSKQEISSRIYETSVQVRRKESVIRFIREIGTVDCFKVGRGKFDGMKKVDLLRLQLGRLVQFTDIQSENSKFIYSSLYKPTQQLS